MLARVSILWRLNAKQEAAYDLDHLRPGSGTGVGRVWSRVAPGASAAWKSLSRAFVRWGRVFLDRRAGTAGKPCGVARWSGRRFQLRRLVMGDGRRSTRGGGRGVHHLGLQGRRLAPLCDADRVWRRTAGECSGLDGDASTQDRATSAAIRRVRDDGAGRRHGAVLQALV